MDLAMDAALAEGYTSASQRARRLTEAWAERELYCVACPSPRLEAHRPNMMVEDFRCKRCERRTQVKAKAGRIGKVVANSAYEPKVLAIRANRAPDYAFLSYDRDALAVNDLMVVPGHLITESVVQRRRALRSTARRAGWVGSNILLDRIPHAGRIDVVSNGHSRPAADVRSAFKRVAFLERYGSERRGWVADVMACIERLGLERGQRFMLTDVYAFEDALARLHPRNQHVRPKVRQQRTASEKMGVETAKSHHPRHGPEGT